MTTGINGRLCRILYHATGLANAGVVVARAKADSLKLSAEPIDITAKDDGGRKLLMNDQAMSSWEMSWSGILAAAPQHRTLIDLWDGGAGASLHGFSFVAPGVGTWEGLCFISSFEVKGEGEAATFDMTLTGSGELAFEVAT